MGNLHLQRYLPIIDYLSKHPSLFQISLTTMAAIIDYLTELFAPEGMPPEIFTMDTILTPRNGTPSQINMSSNISLQACTTLSLMVSLKGMSTPWKSSLGKAKASRGPVPQTWMKLWQTPIGSYLPNPKEILHTWPAGSCLPGKQDFAPVDLILNLCIGQEVLYIMVKGDWLHGKSPK